MIFDEDGKLFCVRLKKYVGKSTGSDNDYWCLPGGGVDPGEALLPALSREIVEELGIDPEIGALLYIQQFLHDGTEHIEFFFHVTNYEDFSSVDIGASSHGAIEIETAAFINPATTNAKPLFLQTEPIAAHAASAGPAKLFAYLD
jgi:8-oxo-dGTP pyrophosphatase MutT (NUDIX family)